MSTIIATPEKRVVMPGQGQIALGHGFSNGKSALVIQEEGQQPKAVELDFENAVALAQGILSTALQVEKAKAARGPILQVNGSG